jgi:hypothetical protein
MKHFLTCLEGVFTIEHLCMIIISSLVSIGSFFSYMNKNFHKKDKEGGK